MNAPFSPAALALHVLFLVPRSSLELFRLKGQSTWFQSKAQQASNLPYAIRCLPKIRLTTIKGTLDLPQVSVLSALSATRRKDKKTEGS